ncbi:type I DNA topoisomerase [Minwuia sp.]|uniref:type I DNA topoisomerase n=1 Tax=Minwuia sp. TaxID=2493630 RepID=UPI003A948BCA
MDVVVVESPAKAKTINKYLGSGYKVLASFGHVRDLPSKDGSVRPEEDFEMTYEADPKSAKHLKAIADAVKDADKLVLATDPDREGEAISWHVLEALKKRRAIKKSVEVERVVFNEITKKSILNAMENPRDIDMDLVNAQQARRALDYLVGFTLSPVLWRKLPGARSAGRVQSVALRLIVERELEIEKFKPREYWSITARFKSEDGSEFEARLARVDDEKLDRLSISTEAEARALVERALKSNFRVGEIETRQTSRRPAPPFITSTLQMEASRKLGMGARQTMQVAQKLYEGIELDGETVGLITYMRTDGVQLAAEAIDAIRETVNAEYGTSFLPSRPRHYETKAKNAQEAHEAIRPTDASRTPAQMRQFLSAEQHKLYDLIWKRTVASQMADARLAQTGVDIPGDGGNIVFRATGTVVEFPGFLKLYEEGRDDAKDDDDDKRLPKLTEGDGLERKAVDPAQHFTQPPPRYSEATLVKRLEELGIGRPSTYASIISVLQDREYVKLDKKRFMPEDKGRVVTAFLSNFFPRYVEYDFTASLEEELDDITSAKIEWKEVLRRFWKDFKASVDDTKELRITEVLDALNDFLAPSLFPEREDGSNPRACPNCEGGSLSLRLGKFGAFLGCSNYPECKFTRQLGGSENDQKAAMEGDREIGVDPATGEMIWLKVGPYGPYLQLGEAEKGGPKPKRCSLPKGLEPNDVDHELAIKLIALPREIGPHPESGNPITAGIGRYGPFVEHEKKYANLPDWREVLDIGINRAVTVIAEAKTRGGRAAPKALKDLGEHPDEGGEIKVLEGRYGPYVKHGKINATIPKDIDPQSISMEEAVRLIAERAAKAGTRKKAAPKKRAAAKKKPAAKKKAAPKKAEGE